MSTVLEKYYDPSYEPSKAEIEEYGKWLGMDLPADDDLLFLAREGLKAPLPEGWKACKSEKGELYYFNFKSGKSIWDHPMDDHYKDTLTEQKRRKASGEPYGVEHHTPVTAPAAKEASPSPSATSDGTSSEKQTSEVRADSQPAPAEDNSPELVRETKRPRPSSGKRQKAKAVAEAAEVTVVFKEADIPEPVVEQKSVPVTGSKLAALKTLKTKKELPRDMMPSANDAPSPLTTLTPAEHNKPAPMSIDNDTAKVATNLKRRSAASTTASSRVVSFADDQRVEEEIQEATRQADEKIAAAKKKLLEETNAEIATYEQKQLDRAEVEKKKLRQSILEQVEKFEKENAAQIQQRKAQLQTEHNSAIKAAQNSHAASISTTKSSFETELKSLQEEHQVKLEEMRSKSSNDLSKAVQSAQSGFQGTVQAAWSDCLSLLETDMARMVQEHSDLLSRKALSDCATASAAITAQGEEEMSRLRESHSQQLDALRAKQAMELDEATKSNEGALAKLHAELADLETKKQSETARIDMEIEVATKAAAMSIAAAQRVEVAKVEPVAVTPAPVTMAPLSPQMLDVVEVVVPTTKHHQDPFNNPSPSSSTSPSSSHQPNTASPLSAGEVRIAIEDALRSIFASGAAPPPPLQQQQQREPTYSRPIVDQRATTVDLNSTLPVCFEDQRRMLDAERGRLVQARQVVDAQQEDIIERQRNLKDAKKQWKSDVIKAKGQGVRGDSEKGQLLRNVHKALERQEAVLRHDENVHQQSETWLQTKADRLQNIEQQLHSIQRHTDLDVSVASETSAMINDFFHTESLGSLTHTRRTASSLNPSAFTTAPSSGSGDPQSEVAKALRRIEKRLDKFAKATAAPLDTVPATRRPPLGELPVQLNMLMPNPSSSSQPLTKHTRKRSSSASKRVGFAPLAPTSYI